MNERQLQDSDLGRRHMDLVVLIIILGKIFSGLIPIRPLKLKFHLVHPHIIHED